ncbi:MAG: hypothetical protein ABI768_03725 [Acidobacteriota bacterium]
MNRIRLLELEIGARAVTFRWSVEPASPLYRRTSFTLEFPASVDVAAVPPALWWRVALLCLHPHWALLRPCEVRLPVRLEPGEAETWLRLVDAAVDTLEATRGTSDTARAVSLLEGARPAPAWRPVRDTGRWAAAFSGGKDSLLTAGLLAEMTQRPVLVTTTSPLPPLHDHGTARRRFILDEIPRRRPLTLVEVASDFRSATDNDFADRMGYPLAVSETTDTLLYLGALLAAGFAQGATHFVVASENEVQENVERDGKTVQHTHFMYAASTLASLDAVFRPSGATISTLTAALHAHQVQRLLVTRYAGLRDLQYSCWSVGERESACSRCSKCLTVALGILAVGGAPTDVGIDLGRLLVAKSDFRFEAPGPSALPGDLVARRIREQRVRDIRAIPTRRVAAALARGRATGLLSPRGARALLAWRRLRRRNAAAAVGAEPGWRPGYLRFADPLLASRLSAIYGGAFPTESPSVSADALLRSTALAEWITAPLSGELDARRNAS